MTKNTRDSCRIAVLGALAYDRIATTQRPFGPAGPGLNSKVSKSSEHFGGCGGNVVYQLAQLNQPSLLLSISGYDDAPYRELLATQPLIDHGIYRDTSAPCANAFILSDPRGTQFTAFQSGPTVTDQAWTKHLTALQSQLADCSMLLCAPFPPELMRATMAFTHKHNPRTLVIWCPGQYADQMDAEGLRQCSTYWHWLVANAYEVDHIRAHAPDILKDKTVITTHGSAPVTVDLPDGGRRTFAVQAASRVVDPTGCGDAFSAGLVNELVNSIKQPLTLLDPAIAKGMQCAKVCLGHHGGQPTPLTRSASARTT